MCESLPVLSQMSKCFFIVRSTISSTDVSAIFLSEVNFVFTSLSISFLISTKYPAIVLKKCFSCSDSGNKVIFLESRKLLFAQFCSINLDDRFPWDIHKISGAINHYANRLIFGESKQFINCIEYLIALIRSEEH